MGRVIERDVAPQHIPGLALLLGEPVGNGVSPLGKFGQRDVSDLDEKAELGAVEAGSELAVVERQVGLCVVAGIPRRERVVGPASPLGDRVGEAALRSAAVEDAADPRARQRQERGVLLDDSLSRGPPPADADAMVEARMRTMDQLDRTLESLRELHLESPKFSQLDIESGRTDFDQMLSEEYAFVSSLQDLSIEWRDLRIDVFGDVAVATSLPRFTMTSENGATSQLDFVSTLVWVKTADGWKIAHENNNAIQAR